MKDASQHAEDYVKLVREMAQLEKQLREIQDKLEGRSGNLKTCREHLSRCVGIDKPIRIFKNPNNREAVIVHAVETEAGRETLITIGDVE